MARDRRPLVSVVTPSYNQSAFIEQTLTSVICQRYPLVEHIVVDGGSTDGAIDIIDEKARRHPDRIRLVSEPDEGQADAINKGFLMSTGDIVAWLNSDDAYLFRSTLDEVVEAFRQQPLADVIYGDAALISADGRLLKVMCVPSFQYNWLVRGCRLVQPSVFMRRRVIEEQLLDPSLSLALDYEYWLRLGRDHRFVHVSRVWSADRNHSSRKILAQRDQMQRQRLAVQERYGRPSGRFQMALSWTDKARYGLPSVLKGLWALRRLYLADASTFAIPLRLESPTMTVKRQLWSRNRNLV